MTNIFIYKYACAPRTLDVKKFMSYFLKNDHILVSNPKHADIIIFFACAAADNITDQMLSLITTFQRYDAELFVIGCLPEIEREKLTRIFNGNTITTENIENIDEFFPENFIKFHEIEEPHLLFENYSAFPKNEFFLFSKKE
ncbi:MAG: hypothetical protein KAW45_00645 [Thermoplasmatales archaeon]|nr:hypothetical protein [Thermoplasmatales archaeon]